MPNGVEREEVIMPVLAEGGEEGRRGHLQRKQTDVRIP
jgi:hypothetical protein